MNFAIRLLTILSLCCAATARAEVPRLVKDINPSTIRQPRMVQKPVVAGPRAYFSAWSREAGQEIWVTDRTVAGTGVLKDVCPGMVSSEPSAFMAAGSRIFFLADDGVHGREPWTSDGTTAGTHLLGDFLPGPDAGNPVLIGASSTRIWFYSQTSTGFSVWSSDGSPEGTIELNPSLAGAERRFGAPRLFCTIGETAYFVTGQADVWRSDGTLEGTQRIEQFDAPPGSLPFIAELVATQNHLYLILSIDRRESLWKTDGSPAAAVQIPRSPESDTWEVFRNLQVSGDDKLFFIGQPELNTEETWRCGDGTLEGSVRFLGDGPPMGSQEAVLFGDALYFLRNDPSAGYELWQSDGTKAGTHLLKDIDPGSRSSDAGKFTVSGPWIYFTAQTIKNGREIWRTDGTAKGTRLVIETARGSGSTLPEELTADNGNLFFLGGQQSLGGDLWFVDGVRRKGRQLTTPGAKGVDGMRGAYSPWYASGISGTGSSKYLFWGNDGKIGSSLWASDGTAKGTKPLIKIKPFNDVSNLESFTPFGDRELFVASMRNQSRQLWITNGSSGGTRQLTRYTTDAAPRVVTNGTAAFFASGESIYSRLWTTDGTVGGTRQLFRPDGEPFNLMQVSLHLDGSTLYFVSITPSLTRELWRTDGTGAGTVLIKNNFPAPLGQQSLSLGNFRQAGDKVCFTVGDFQSSQLWSTDGTTEGTLPVPFDISPAASVKILRSLPFESGFIFLATLKSGDTHWWISNGTTEGTQRLTTTPVSPGDVPINGEADPHMVLGGKLLFVADDATHGRELWITDGTPQGTGLFADIRSGTAPSYPAEFTLAGDRMYFTADDGVNGRELWVTDGTPEGTLIAAEILPGTTSSYPSQLRVVGNRLFFGAESLYQGYELHTIDLPLPTASLRLAASSATVESSTLPASSQELLNLAFNLPPGNSAASPLIPGTGTFGFPSFSRSIGVFRVEYLRRNDGQLRYTAKCSTSLEPGSFVPMSGAETVVDIDELWQRVVIEHPISGDTPHIFGIVEVEPR